MEVSTGCTDKAAAEQRLREFERQADRVRSGVVTSAEDKAVLHQQAGIAGHFAAFIDQRKTQGRCSRPQETLSQLERVAADCSFARLAEVDGNASNGG